MNPFWRRRRALLILAAVAILALLAAPAALAAAGGGSGGFGGGGGGGGFGGGGGGGGGGRGVAIYFLLQLLVRIALIGHGIGALVLIGLLIAYAILVRVVPGAQHAWGARARQGRADRRRSHRRQRRVELAAAEAAEENPAFAPDVVRPAAAQLFTDIQGAWDSRDRAALERLIAPGLRAEWERRLDDFDRRGWHNRVQPLDEPTVEYVGLRNVGDRHQDRVVVRIEARMRDYVVDRDGRHLKRLGRATETVRVREFWTLGRSADDSSWILVSVEQGAEGSHALNEEIVATPWSDERGLRDEALVEQAMADALPDEVKPSEVADLQFAGDARAATLDLSLADGRFAPDVLEVAARRAVAAWAEAVDGQERALREVADRGVMDALLHPGDPSRQTRLVVRGPEVRQIRIVGLDAAADPPTMTLEVDLAGRRYIEDRSTARVLQGSPNRAVRFTEHWTLALSGDAAQPWQIVAVGAPANRT